MSEIYKGVIISFVVFLLWSFGCFVGGYLLSNARATKRINESNQQLAEQQQKYDTAIREAEERIRIADERLQSIGTELSQQVSNNGKATKELAGIIEQIRKQKLNIQI